jgi:hypothetical protein
VRWLVIGIAGFAFVILPTRASGQETEHQSEARPVDPAATKHQRAEEELKQQEHQRIMGVIPNFNTSYVQNAAPLTPSQKFRLALRSATDPVAFLTAGFVAGIEQARDTFPDYGQGGEGYAKRFGAAYVDSFNGGMLGNALFPALLHQDPRYFRKGTGPFSHRLFYAIASTVRTRNDNGRWAPNYSNLLGNLAAGGISNLYYPESDRGFVLTVQRALTVSAEGALGSIFVEFWPDISAKLFGKNKPNQK